MNNKTYFDFSFQHTKGLGVLADMRGSMLLRGKGPTLLQIACCQVVCFSTQTCQILTDKLFRTEETLNLACIQVLRMSDYTNSSI
jgi:hypothetical protein